MKYMNRILDKIKKAVFGKNVRKKEENEFRIYELEKRLSSIEYSIKSNNKEA